jgi:transposase
MRYVHLACTAYLTLLHTGDRSAEAIDAGGVVTGRFGSWCSSKVPQRV